MRAFISGGSGFIGNYITQRLLEEKHHVTIFDIKPPIQFDSQVHATYISGDLLNLEQVSKAIEGHDIVYHLAANADISLGATDTAMDLQLTTIATYNVLEAMRNSSTKKLVYLSGSGVYGDAGSTVLAETAGPSLPVSLYGASKLAAEGLISAFSHMFGIAAIVLRPANIVGGGQTHGVLFDFVRKLRDDPTCLEILGDGNQSKSYLHISDLYSAITILLQQASSGITLLNIGTDDLIDVNWIASEVIGAMRLADVRVKHTGGKVGWIGDIPRVQLDSTKLKNCGWQPRYTSREAIQISLSEMLKIPPPIVLH